MGPQKSRGRKKRYDGKVNLKQLDPNKVKLVYENNKERLFAFQANVVRLDINVSIAYLQRLNSKGEVKDYSVYFSTDRQLEPKTIREIYAERFQIELLIRDAKQHTGLTHCQARDLHKLNFHFNTAFSAIGLAKAIDFPKNKQQVFSMANYKTLFHNHLMLNLFFSNFDIELSSKKNKRIYRKLLRVGAIAA